MRQDARHRSLEEYLFGDLELPREVPSLAELSQITVRRRRYLQPDAPLQPKPPR
jgi:hypothetical protein